MTFIRTKRRYSLWHIDRADGAWKPVCYSYGAHALQHVELELVLAQIPVPPEIDGVAICGRCVKVKMEEP